MFKNSLHSFLILFSIILSVNHHAFNPRCNCNSLPQDWEDRPSKIFSSADQSYYVSLMIYQVVELLNEVAVYVKEKEPGTLKYEIHRQINKKSGDDEVIMIERFARKKPPQRPLC